MSFPSAQPVVGDHIVTLGCRLNIAESETIRALVRERDVAVVNTCAVTNAAMRQSRRAVRRLRRERPDATLVVTGCAAEIDRAGFAAMPEVDRIVANTAKLDPAAWDAPAAPPQRFDRHARALVEVQNGCDHACTFCIIPQGRGASRSLPAGGVIDRVRALVDAGHREVVLTGVDLTSYGDDLPGIPTLGMLVERILRLVPDLERLRLSSIDCAEIDDRLFALLAHEPRVMPHVHLSLQAGDDLILKRMKRRHSRAQAVALVDRLRAARPEIAIGADLIAGFPTEDERAFANTLALIEDCAIVHAHIFPFSPRDGTPAARMPQVAAAIVRDRAGRLRAAAAARKARWLDTLIGTRQRVLIERPGDRGHTPCFAEVRLAHAAEPGTLVDVAIAGSDGTFLTGDLT
ncbi:tRNA (N(6)-L-threonylcarbamoyladenosine(37)-C(2))-methylthiotransferase MtaB [Sphingomonas baiyangensis]|uniref:tRNA (N(6)-L-threonylcarbamoyladenosine(37)-C(2))-methylthiotransferase n=1 Tax=Sphingomonas baiyangensis TaxID=2572576 RepID=A0A4U1L3W4_9SPHN|nr:tRNA (N(6)-L-threonylcarbamoyladenosine(37)-C(2))-methylthiotransferase MtaB [Sphingomonas baiyangensis]TKD50883.1 tRNA (N(6)-L-threonylcarbamoyladenosine(37)-C(2))-methylthiotransferase MtaB [Sphingomonas baiyangensis]